jgi:KaiC/GvpD/RAD55 family RecA-like ATPase
MKRVPTGIPGLDQLIQGGFPQGSTILVSGGAGTGKTIFALQYIYAGAALYNEPGVFITFEEPPKNLIWNLQNFGWDYVSLNKQGLMKIFKVSVDPVEQFAANWRSHLNEIINTVKEMGAQRVALDSISAIGALLAERVTATPGSELWVGNALAVRAMVKELSDRLKELDVTSVFTSGTSEDSKTSFSSFGVEEFIVDGVIRLYFIPPRRALFIRKMRGTAHSSRVHPMSITDKGIVVNANDEIMWEALK